jgi:hypothetical protein
MAKEKSINIEHIFKNLYTVHSIDQNSFKSFLSDFKSELEHYILEWFKIKIPWLLYLHSWKSIPVKKYYPNINRNIKTKIRRKLRCKIWRTIQNKIFEYDQIKKNS